MVNYLANPQQIGSGSVTPQIQQMLQQIMQQRKQQGAGEQINTSLPSSQPQQMGQIGGSPKQKSTMEQIGIANSIFGDGKNTQVGQDGQSALGQISSMANSGSLSDTTGANDNLWGKLWSTIWSQI